MTNRISDGIDRVANFTWRCIDVVPKGGYALAVVFLLLAYGIQRFQVGEYHSQATQSRADMHKIVEHKQGTTTDGCLNNRE